MKSFLAAVAVLVSAPAFARGVVQRSEHLETRIAHGVATGQLNRAEANRLDRSQDRLERQIARDMVDGGGLTRAERATLHAKEDRLSTRVAVQKHDRHVRR